MKRLLALGMTAERQVRRTDYRGTGEEHLPAPGARRQSAPKEALER